MHNMSMSPFSLCPRFVNDKSCLLHHSPFVLCSLPIHKICPIRIAINYSLLARIHLTFDKIKIRFATSLRLLGAAFCPLR